MRPGRAQQWEVGERLGAPARTRAPYTQWDASALKHSRTQEVHTTRALVVRLAGVLVEGRHGAAGVEL